MSRPPTPRYPQPYSPRRPSPLGFPPLAPHVAFQQPTYSWPHTPDRTITLSQSLQPKHPVEVRIQVPQEARRGMMAGSTERPGAPGIGSMSQPPPPLPLPPTPGEGNGLRSSGMGTGMGTNSAGSLVTPSIVIGGEGWKLAQPPKTATILETGEERSIHSQRNSYQSQYDQHRDPYTVEGELLSPTRSEASTLSLYSADSVTKTFPAPNHPKSKPGKDEEARKKGQELEVGLEEEKSRSFCGCFGFLFGKSSKAKAKEARILGPPDPHRSPTQAFSPRKSPSPSFPSPTTTQPLASPQMVQVKPLAAGRRRPSPLNL